MHETWILGLVWWITAAELAALAGLFWLYRRLRRETEDAIDDARHETETGFTYLRDRIAASEHPQRTARAGDRS